MMQDAKKKIEYQRHAGKELGRGSGESRHEGKRLRTEAKEVSRITGVPLLRESCSRDDFAVFEQAWFDHCQATFPLDGRCRGAHGIYLWPGCDVDGESRRYPY